MPRPGSAIAQLAETARDAGWQAALHDHLRIASPEAYRYASDPQSASWRALLDTPPDSRVLFIYSGVGVAPFLFAADGAEVTCACALDAEVDYITSRAQQQGLSQLNAFRYDGAGELPGANGAYDLVIAVEALGPSLSGERAALRCDDVLGAARRLLGDGGRFFLAGSRRHVPSPAAARRLLDVHGFGGVRAFGLVPAHWQPFFVLPLDEPTSLRHACRRIASGYDFSARLPGPMWAIWRTLAAPCVDVLAAVGLMGMVTRAMPAYGYLCSSGGAI